MVTVAALALLVQMSPVNFELIKVTKPGTMVASANVPIFGGSPVQDFATAQLHTIAKARLDGWVKENVSRDPQVQRGLQYTFDMKPTVCTNSKSLVSVYFQVFMFMGGAHPITTFEAVNFGLVNGKPARLKATDMFRSGAPVTSVVSGLLMQKLMTNDRAIWVQNGDVKGITAKQVENVVVTKSGLTWLFNQYDLAPYAFGAFQVKVPFSELASDLDPNGPLSSVIAK